MEAGNRARKREGTCGRSRSAALEAQPAPSVCHGAASRRGRATGVGDPPPEEGTCQTPELAWLNGRQRPALAEARPVVLASALMPRLPPGLLAISRLGA